MRKLVFPLLTFAIALPVLAAGDAATITSTPSPVISNKAVEIKVKTSDFGSEVYCYTWCEAVNNSKKTPFEWGGVHTDKFRMTGSGGNYGIRISDLKEFYGLSDSELEGLTKIGIIAKTKEGRQTEDLFLEVVQGRRNAYSGGEGTSESPFILKTAADLQELATTPGDWEEGIHLVMEADIDALGIVSSIGTIASPFKGNFDGMGHAIKNLNLSNNNIGAACGLFGAIEVGSVKNLGITGAIISGSTYTGILAGMLKSGKIERCFTSGSVKGSSICSGGLVGENISGIISDCYSGAVVSNPEDYAVGGLVGKNRGTILNTYASGEVTGFDYTGGVVGANYGTIKGSVALNTCITSHNDYAAMFGGNNNEENITDKNYSWRDMPKGHNAWKEHGDHASGKSATDLANESTFRTLTGWDFDNIWEWRKEGRKEYPVLRGIENQRCLISDVYFEMSVSLKEILTLNKDFYAGPNPVETLLEVSSGMPLDSYALYGLNGAIVSGGQAGGTHTVSIDMSGLASGLYILRANTTEGESYTQKIIKK